MIVNDSLYCVDFRLVAFLGLVAVSGVFGRLIILLVMISWISKNSRSILESCFACCLFLLYESCKQLYTDMKVIHGFLIQKCCFDSWIFCCEGK